YFNENRTVKLSGSALWKITESAVPEQINYTPDLKELNESLYIKHCPGHTKGSVVIFVSIENLVYAFVGGVFLNREYFESWTPPGMSWKEDRIYEHMNFIKENADVIIPGHGEPFRVFG
ncbi:MAG: hypothetical protein GY730_08930, partial [bacterium]|nr:hypothetical protein [bacterium]